MKIVILGGGTAGWMSAACIARSLGTRNHSITLVESSEISTIGVGEATIPMIGVFNKIIGVSPWSVIKNAKATFKLGIEFADWKRKGHSYFHPFGSYGIDMNGVSFTHYWLRQLASGKDVDLSHYSRETLAARSGDFSLRLDAPQNIPRLTYAYHFDAGLYAQQLRTLSESLGVLRIDAKMQSVQRNSETGDVEALKLETGQEIEGDLFIDCSGFRALLIDEALGVDYVDWTKYLPCDRAVVVASEVHDPLPAYTLAKARDAGWQWRIPLQHRTGNGYVYSSQFTSDDEAETHFLEGLDRPAIGSPRKLQFKTGHRSRMWEKNVISMGLSSGFLEPLESTSIYLVQSALTKLMIAFPRGGVNDKVRDIFNEAMVCEYESIRDFLVAHYVLTEREDTPFWKHCKYMDVPDSLTEFLTMYEEDGVFLKRNNDLFKEVSWFSVLHGQGLTPKKYHPIADAADDESFEKQMLFLQEQTKKAVVDLPDHNAFVQSCIEGRPIS